MELTFYCASDPAVRFKDARNRGIEVVRSLLEEFERRGVKVRRIEPRTLSSEQLLDAYAQAMIPAICKKYAVKSNVRDEPAFGMLVRMRSPRATGEADA